MCVCPGVSGGGITIIPSGISHIFCQRKKEEEPFIFHLPLCFPLQPFLVPLKKEENCMFFSCPPLLFLLWWWHLSLLAPAAPPRNKDATTTQEISAKVEHVFFLEKQASFDSHTVVEQLYYVVSPLPFDLISTCFFPRLCAGGKMKRGEIWTALQFKHGAACFTFVADETQCSLQQLLQNNSRLFCWDSLPFISFLLLCG